MQGCPPSSSERGPAHSLAEHVRRTLALSLPVVVARCGLLVLIAVDTAMTGHAGGSELAAYALSMAPQIPLQLLGIGMLMGTVVLSAQAVGGGREHECGAVWRSGLVHALVLGLIVLVLCLLGEAFLRATGQTEALSADAGRVLLMFGYGMPGLFLFTATVFFLEGINQPRAGMVVMLLANVLNAGLNWVFIYGNLGAPALGAEGAALATSLVRWCMFLAVAAWVLLAVDRDRFGLRAGSERQPRDLGRRLRRIGYPMALALVLESAAFSAMVLFAGHLGEAQVGAYQVAMNLCALTFMTAIGFGTAASVRVGNAVGRGDSEGVRWAGWVAVGLGILTLAALGAVLGLLPGPIAMVYSSDPAVLAVAVPTLVVAAMALVPDGAQGVIMGALRGAADAWPATALYLFSFWMVMAPLGYYLGVMRTGGAPALMVAVMIGGITATLTLGLRFHVVSRRAIARA